MTEIGFHFNVGAPAGYACRLVRKALRQGSPVTVTGPRPLLETIDRELWALGPTEFVPHAWTADATAVPARLHPSTAWLASEPLDAPLHHALVNVGTTVPRGFESYRRLIEVISADEPDRVAARERWRSYAGRGYAIQRHQVAE
ncbi:MAG: DNA polymerase III subunit chi [Pseudomonadota bacterium]|nr:DNA polymerase III subunit chi [Pseudomonadota bacterium]